MIKFSAVSNHFRFLVGLGMILLCVSKGLAYDEYCDLRFDPRISARYLGMGAQSGWQTGAEAVFGNPANLAVLRNMELSSGVGMFADNSLIGTFAYGQPIPEIGKFGLGFSMLYPNSEEVLADDSLDKLNTREQIFSLGYGRMIAPSWLQAGIRFRALHVNNKSGNEAGESIDLGLRFQFNNFFAGITGINLLQPQINLKGAGIAYPRRAQLNLGMAFKNIMQVGVEYTQALEGDLPFRAALGWESAFSAKWFIRNGVDTRSVYLGFGYFDRSWGIDYAGRADFDLEDIYHCLGVRFKWGTHRVGLESSSKYLTKGGITPRVTIKINYQRKVLFKRWALLILNSKGRMVKCFVGKNKFPGSVTWEGRNNKGRMVPDDAYTCFLEGVDYEGNLLKSNFIYITVMSRKEPEFHQVK
ncbi:hypothetical protein KAR34_09170 [bacterium]|nr:hypothetical protein [bacterium]